MRLALSFLLVLAISAVSVWLSARTPVQSSGDGGDRWPALLESLTGDRYVCTQSKSRRVSQPDVLIMTATLLDPESGQSFHVSLAQGPPDEVGVHTPDMCFRGNGYEMIDPAPQRLKVLPVSASPHDFAAARFRRRHDGLTTSLIAYWSWLAGGRWVLPENPRVALAGQATVYKLYVIREADEPEHAVADPETLTFVRHCCAQLGHSLFRP